MSKKWEFRDVSVFLQSLRQFLLGRKHTLHPRFPLRVAPRSIPPPDIPRGPEYKYSKQYYFERNAFDSVRPPVVAPVAEGPPVGKGTTKKNVAGGGMKSDNICFTRLPTPGVPWCWDGHSYFECVPEDRPTCPPPPPQRAEPSPCASKPEPPYSLSSEKQRKV